MVLASGALAAGRLLLRGGLLLFSAVFGFCSGGPALVSAGSTLVSAGSAFGSMDSAFGSMGCGPNPKNAPGK